MLSIALLLSAPAHAQAVCGDWNYNTDPAGFASLPVSDFQDLAPQPSPASGYTDAAPFVHDGVGYWTDWWPTNSWCIPGMDSAPPCGGDNVYLANPWQLHFAPQTPSDAIGFDWGTQGQSVDITVHTSDGQWRWFGPAGQSGFFGYCTGDPAITVLEVVLESADGGLDNVRVGAMVAAPPALDLWVAPQAVVGMQTELIVRHAQPGETVHFAWSTTAGAGPCPAQLGGQCLGLVNPRYAGALVADANGEAALQIVVPAGLGGRTVYVQAAVPRGVGGADSALTAVGESAVF